MKINKNIIGFSAIVIMLSLSGIISLNQYFKDKVSHDKVDIRSFPYAVGDWKGRDLEIKEYEYKILETRNLISREYTNSSNQKLYLFIIYSETNRSVFHPPEVCMLGSGLAIVDKQLEMIDSGGKMFSTNKLYTEKNGYKELVLYSYKAGSLYTNNFYLQQAYLAMHQVFGKRAAGATIRVSMSARKDEAQTLTVLKDFIKETVSILNQISS
ncbi:MAG: exosortase C-terminal domain/associated protein EpsI [Candidatus Omnitrophota bacterium]